MLVPPIIDRSCPDLPLTAWDWCKQWCKPWSDLQAAHAAGIPFFKWLLWFLGTDAKRAVALDDPLPIMAGGGWQLSQKLRAALASRPQSPAPATRSVEA